MLDFAPTRFFLTTATLRLLFAPFALADDGDVYVTVDHELTSELAEDLSVGETGDALHDAQGRAHDAVTDATGEEIDHYYIYVCFGDECIPVDPVRYSN